MTVSEWLEQNWWVALIRGLIAIAFGILVIVWPDVAVKTLVLIFAIFLLVDGLIAAIGSLMNTKYRDWWVGLVIGIIEIGIGVATLVRPEITLTVILILIGLWAIFRGLVEFLLGIAIRNEVTGEWILILAGLISMLFGVLALLAPFIETGPALLVMIGIYALVIGVIWVIVAFSSKSLAKDLRELEAATE